jgi:hypothetical protein
MKCELWKEKDSLTFAPKENIREMLRHGIINKRAKKIWKVTAKTWEEAMTKYHKYMGWEPYVPFKER